MTTTSPAPARVMRPDFNVTVEQLPTMPVEELSRLKLWCDDQISAVKAKLEREKAHDPEVADSDWWRRANGYVRKLGRLSQAIQEQARCRKNALSQHPDVQFLACLKRAMKATLSQELYDRIIATAVELSKEGAA